MTKSKVELWESEDLINYLVNNSPPLKGPKVTNAESIVFEQELMEMHRTTNAKGPGSVRFHKDRLGKQDYTWIGEYRFWIWESRETSLGTPPRWRVFVSDTKGTCFELIGGLTKKQVREAWDDYRRRTLILQWPPGTRVLCYVNNEPGSIVGPCPRNPDAYLVKMDSETKHQSIQIGNIVEAK